MQLFVYRALELWRLSTAVETAAHMLKSCITRTGEKTVLHCISGIPLEVAHYNTLLAVYNQNKFKFSPSEFLTNMEANGVAPNRVCLSVCLSVSHSLYLSLSLCYNPCKIK